MEHGREQSDTDGLVRCGKRYRHEIQQRGDAARRLRVRYCECGRHGTHCEWGKHCAYSCTPARREEQHHCEMRRRREYAVVELHRRLVLGEISPRTLAPVAGVGLAERQKLVQGRREANAH